MSQADWNTTDRIMYGVMCSGIILWAIATFIEACRSRPKIQMMVLSLKQLEKPGPDESQSAAVDE